MDRRKEEETQNNEELKAELKALLKSNDCDIATVSALLKELEESEATKPPVAQTREAREDKARHSLLDKRMDLYQSEQYRTLAGSVVSLWSSDDIIDIPILQSKALKTETLKEALSKRFGSNKFSDGELFLTQPTGAFGTGFLVSSKIDSTVYVITAGHCVKKKNGDFIFRGYEEKIRFIVGYALSSNDIPSAITVKPNQIFKGELMEVNTEKDFAIFRLQDEKNLVNFKSLEISVKEPVVNQPVFTLGHPDGLPLKVTDNGKVTNISEDNFLTDLDTFHGNSGSPVFSNDQVVGILISGQKDWIIEGGIIKSAVYTITGEEESLKLSSIRDILEQYNLISKQPSSPVRQITPASSSNNSTVAPSISPIGTTVVPSQNTEPNVKKTKKEAIGFLEFRGLLSEISSGLTDADWKQMVFKADIPATRKQHFSSAVDFFEDLVALDRLSEDNTGYLESLLRGIGKIRLANIVKDWFQQHNSPQTQAKNVEIERKIQPIPEGIPKLVDEYPRSLEIGIISRLAKDEVHYNWKVFAEATYGVQESRRFNSAKEWWENWKVNNGSTEEFLRTARKYGRHDIVQFVETYRN